VHANIHGPNDKTLCGQEVAGKVGGLHEMGYEPMQETDKPPTCGGCIRAWIEHLQRKYEWNDDWGFHFRMWLIDIDEPYEKETDEAIDAADIMAAQMLVTQLKESDYDGREYLTELCLNVSLCPMHFGDYASCFDDENPECAAIRVVHPLHDT
jgi:hypothetical protein